MPTIAKHSRSLSVSVPGKILLCGGYLILNEEHDGVVLSLPAFMTCTSCLMECHQNDDATWGDMVEEVRNDMALSKSLQKLCVEEELPLFCRQLLLVFDNPQFYPTIKFYVLRWNEKETSALQIFEYVYKDKKNEELEGMFLPAAHSMLESCLRTFFSSTLSMMFVQQSSQSLTRVLRLRILTDGHYYSQIHVNSHYDVTSISSIWLVYVLESNSLVF
jgi:hypothetical protein